MDNENNSKLKILKLKVPEPKPNEPKENEAIKFLQMVAGYIHNDKNKSDYNVTLVLSKTHNKQKVIEVLSTQESMASVNLDLDMGKNYLFNNKK